MITVLQRELCEAVSLCAQLRRTCYVFLASAQAWVLACCGNSLTSMHESWTCCRREKL